MLRITCNNGGMSRSRLLVLAAVIWSEVRGEPDVTIGRRRIGTAVQRQALSVTLLAVGLVIGSTIALMVLTDLPSLDLAFEVVSAFAPYHRPRTPQQRKPTEEA